ncbi:hypothetical protein [Nonlabens dokdonensis]|nr:hypothetical protein [Nonlabens dokdonensis]
MNEGLNIFDLIDSFSLDYSDIEIWVSDDRSFYLDYLKAIDITEKQDNFIKAYKRHLCNVSKACRKVNIHRSTYYDWKNKSDSFSNLVDSAREEMYDDIESILLNKIIVEGNTRLLMFYASTRMKDRGYGSTVIVKGDNRLIQGYSNKYSGMTIEQLDSKISELQDFKQ